MTRPIIPIRPGHLQACSLRAPVILVLALLAAACKHPLAIVGEGDIVDLNEGTYGCSLEQFQNGDPACDNEVTSDYFPVYSAVPREGWAFSHWDGSCGHGSEQIGRAHV